MKKIAGYRKMLDLTQKDMANKLGISKQSYWLKENGKVAFSDKEKLQIKNEVKEIIPDITIDNLFF